MDKFVWSFLLVAAFAVASTQALSVDWEKIESILMDEKIYRGNITSKKHNESTMILTTFHEHMVTYNQGDVKIKVVGMKHNGNTYEPTPIQLDLEYCMAQKSHEYADINKDSNVPPCPVPPGIYWQKNVPLHVDLAKYGHMLPPNAAGKWKAQMDYTYKGTHYLQTNLYMTIKN